MPGFLECVDGCQLVSTGCVGKVRVEALEGAEEFVCRCEHWAGKVVVSEVDGVADGDRASVF